MSNKQKFLALVSKTKTTTATEIKERVANRSMLRESQRIALKILLRLDELDWTQKELAAKLNVSPQHVSKMLSGKENLTLKTLVQLQEILNIALLASHQEHTKATKKTTQYDSELIQVITNGKLPQYSNGGKVIQTKSMTGLPFSAYQEAY
jgi:transcriptional regulator with XRE-family HTH domain